MMTHRLHVLHEARQKLASSAWRPASVRRSRPGTSLVEILVVLVVLVVGIFSLVRLFPPGFGFILYGKNVTQGSTLARSELERLRTAASHLPDGIGPINPYDPTVVDYLLDPGAELLPFIRTAGLPEEPRFSDVNKFRRVWGETTKIPAPTSDSPYLSGDPATGQPQPASLYTLAFAPVYSATPIPNVTSGIVVYSGTPLQRVVFDGPPTDADLRRLGEESYGIDYPNATLYFAPSTFPRQFKMEYSFTRSVSGNSFVRESSVPDSVLYVPPGVTQFDLRAAHTGQPSGLYVPLPAGARLEPDEEQVFRAFQRLEAGVSFNPYQPYEYKILNPIVGIIGFNPLGAAGRGGFMPGGRPLVAKIDYDLDDWHIIREDRVVPQLGPFVVELTLDSLKRTGDIEENQQQYIGLLRSYPDRPTAPLVPGSATSGQPDLEGIDVIIVDLDTGLTMDSLTLQTEPLPGKVDASSLNLNGAIDYNRGRIEFNQAVRWTMPNGQLGPEQSIAGRRIRIYYRTEKDWGVQITKAYDHYRRELQPELLGNAQYYQGAYEGGRPAVLYFPPIEHDRSVVVDYTWVQQVPGAVGAAATRLVTESGELHQINSPSDPESPQNRGFAPAPLATNWWLRLNAWNRPDLDPNEPIVIQSVRGVSLQARAIWREGTRWRHVEQTTLLSR
jgi:hypothetical protein